MRLWVLHLCFEILVSVNLVNKTLAATARKKITISNDNFILCDS
jgi:hypothetical protein